MSPELITNAEPIEEKAVSRGETEQEQTSACSESSPMAEKLHMINLILLGCGAGTFGSLVVFLLDVIIYGSIQNSTVLIIGGLGFLSFLVAVMVNRSWEAAVIREAL